MKGEYKTKEQLIDELVEMRQRVAELEAADTERVRAEQAIPERRIWLPVAGMFVLLCILVWLNEIVDLPHLLLGAPHTPINWREAIIEMVLIAGVGLFVVLRLIRDITERKRAEQAVRRQRDELAARAGILSATLRTMDLDELLDIILNEVLAFLQVEFGSIHLVQGNEVVLRCWRGLSDAFRAHVLSFSADDPPDWMRELRVIHEWLSQQGLTPDFAKRDGIQAWAGIPLCLPARKGEAGEWLGTILAGSRRYEALSEDEVRALEAMADQVALAIDHARTYRQAQERLARLQTLRDIDRAIIQQLDLREVLHVVLERVPKELGADAAAISLLDEGQLRPKIFAMRLQDGTFVEEEVFTLAENLLHWFVERQKPVIIYDLTQDPRVQMHRGRIRNDRLISYLGVPLIVHDRTIGIFHIMAAKPKVFADEDVGFFCTMAGQVAIAIENARLYEAVKQELTERKRAEEELQRTLAKLREALGGIIQTVALTVETRDPYTAGHQRRVADLARAIANEIGLPEEQIDGIRMAGLIHDLGKIGVPAGILSWPGQLNDLQFGLIKMHSQIGYDILKTVEFPWPVAQIVLQHHERLDGSGYPQGLSGDEIMPEARILAVADVVEAMASRRPYRPPRGLDKALEEISQHRGVLYDAEAVDACLKLFIEKGFEFE